MKEFNHFTHDDFYECKQGVVASTSANTIMMEQGTADYMRAYQETLDKRKRIREEHEEKEKALSAKKRSYKRVVQHERVSIYLQQNYLNRPRKIKALLQKIVAETQKQKEKVPKSLNMEFVYSLVSRMHQSHLLLSRAYKYATYHRLSEADTAFQIMESLECVAFTLYQMFGEKQNRLYRPYSQIRWKMYDLRFYIDFYISEVGKRKKMQNGKSLKKQKNHFVLGHQKHQNVLSAAQSAIQMEYDNAYRESHV